MGDETLSSNAVGASIEALRGVVCGERCGEGAVPPSQKKNRFWISNRQILVQTGCFLYSSPKADLNAVPAVKITLGTPFPGVPAGNDP